MKIENKEKQQEFNLIQMYDVEGFITFELSWKTSNFSGKWTICICKESLKNFTDKIQLLEINESVLIQDNDSDSYISITKIDSLWHYDISYQVCWSHQNAYCKLFLNTDSIGIDVFSKLLN